VTLDEWRARYEELDAETARLRGERDAAREEAARAVDAFRNIYEAATRQLAEPPDHELDHAALTAIATQCEFAEIVRERVVALRAGEAVEAVEIALRQIIKNRQGDIGAFTYAASGPDPCKCSECLATEALTRLEVIFPKSALATLSNTKKTKGVSMTDGPEETDETD